MHIINRIAALHGQITAWRRNLHAHPETAFEERRPRHDFNKDILPIGASYWAGLVEAELRRKG